MSRGSGARPPRRVLVVEDSTFTRRALAAMIDSDPAFAVVASAADGEEAIRLVLRHRPDVVVLDLGLPRLGGLGFIRWVMRHQPVPVLVVTGSRAGREVFQALELGAVDFLIKPSARATQNLLGMRRELIQKLRLLDSLPARWPQVAGLRALSKPSTGDAKADRFSGASDEALPVIAIGTSTGGPPALQFLLGSLPGDWRGSIVVAQHMPALFTRVFAQRLNRSVPLEVLEASEGEELRPGRCLILPGGKQGTLERRSQRLRIHLRPQRQNERYAPSANVLFRSAAAAVGGCLVALVLTGMGDDGAEGVRRVSEAAGRVVAEDRASAVVFGMPAEAIRSGCVDLVLPLEAIARFLREVGSPRRLRFESEKVQPV
ncbi:MAG: chemotaxis-specific protein-glutamate methyltransferase CheB [Acidobacteriota bacterium]